MKGELIRNVRKSAKIYFEELNGPKLEAGSNLKLYGRSGKLKLSTLGKQVSKIHQRAHTVLDRLADRLAD